MTAPRVPGEAALPARIVHVMPQIGIGGAETQLLKLIIGSGESACHEVLYYSDSLDLEGLRLYQEAGVRLVRVPRTRRRPLQFLRSLAREIRLRRPDVVHCWLTSGAVWGRSAAILAGAQRIIVSYRGTFIPSPRFMRLLERMTARRVVHCANSRACAQQVARSLGLAPECFHIIYNGVDLHRFSAAEADGHIRAELGVRDDERLVVNIGRLTPPKNQFMFLRVARACVQTGLPLRFVLVGHGELESQLRRQAAELGVADRVTFLGLRHDIAAILKAADIFCYTSLREGFPNALLEALAAGCPIITTDFPGAGELVENGRTGLIVGIDQDAQMISAIRQYLQDPGLASRVGKAAAQAACDRFSISRMVDDTLAMYEVVMADSR